MDFLGRTNFCLLSHATKGEASLCIRGHTFPVTITNNTVLWFNVFSSIDSGLMCITDNLNLRLIPTVHLQSTTELPPHTGHFVEGEVISPEFSAVSILPYIVTTVSERRCPLWIANDTSRVVRLIHGSQLGTVVTIEKVFASTPATATTAHHSFLRKPAP